MMQGIWLIILDELWWLYGACVHWHGHGHSHPSLPTSVLPAGPRVTKTDPTEGRPQSMMASPRPSSSSLHGEGEQKMINNVVYMPTTPLVDRHIGMQPGCSNLRWWRCGGCCYMSARTIGRCLPPVHSAVSVDSTWSCRLKKWACCCTGRREGKKKTNQETSQYVCLS